MKEVQRILMEWQAEVEEIERQADRVKATNVSNERHIELIKPFLVYPDKFVGMTDC